MKALDVNRIAKFVEQYPVLGRPLEILYRRASGNFSADIAVSVVVKRMDIFFPFFVGNPTHRRAWITGKKKYDGLEGIEEARAYAYIPTLHDEKSRFYYMHEWQQGDSEKIGNMLHGFLLNDHDIEYVIIEISRFWHEHRKSLVWEPILGRTPLKAIQSLFLVVLPPKEETAAELFARALRMDPKPDHMKVDAALLGNHYEQGKRRQLF